MSPERLRLLEEIASNVAECGRWRRAICSPPSFDAACPAEEIVTLAERGEVCAIALGSEGRSGS